MCKFKLILLLLLAIPSVGNAAAPSRTYNYVAHTTIDPTQNNTNENTLYTYLQTGVDTYASGSITNDAISSTAAIAYSKLNLLGAITNSDISTSAAIAYSKLNLSNSILNSDINASAAIVDTKLAQITTASKVSGTAITLLTSLPSGAGIIPTINLGSGTANSSTFLRGDQTYAVVTDINTGNLLFSYIGQVDQQGTSLGEVVGTTFVPNNVSGNYRFLQGTQDTNAQIWSTRWTKIAGVSTVTIKSRVWSRNSTGQAGLTVFIGAATNTAYGTAGQHTPEWISFTINVSALVNGTVYDVLANTANSGNTDELYCSDIIGFGS